MTTYYLILDEQLGKEENRNYYLYKDGSWIPDSTFEIKDRLMGYDPDETDFYGIGNTSIMNEIKEISEETAIEFMNRNPRQK